MKWILLAFAFFSMPTFAAKQYTEAECILLKQQVTDYKFRLGDKSPLSIKTQLNYDIHCNNPTETRSKKSAFLTNKKVPNNSTVISKDVSQKTLSPKLIQTRETTTIVKPFSTVAKMLMPMFLLFFLGLMTFYYFKKKLPQIKGRIGENHVRKGLIKYLDSTKYTIINDVTLPLEDGGTTQVDHIVVSTFGIFVIETKNMSGWIFGNEHQAKWTQTIRRSKYPFQNPLRQNYKHTKTLALSLDMPYEHFHSVVVFTSNAELKTKMPSNVGHLKEMIVYIKSFNEEVFDNQTILEIITLIQNIKLKQGRTTNRRHIKYLESKNNG